MSDSLGTYLYDHSAGSHFAIELLEFLRDRPKANFVSAAAASLLSEVENDRAVLQGIIDRTGEGPPLIKEAIAWVSEKISRLKLRPNAFGTFEALEALALGILGKRALWEALAAIADSDTRVSGVDFRQLVERAKEQHAQVEELRVQAARLALQRAGDD